MKRVSDVRARLNDVDGALVPFEPESAEQGDLQGTAQPFWSPDRSRGETLVPIPEDEFSEDSEDASGARQLDELIEFAPASEEKLIAALGGPQKAGELLRSRIVARGLDALGWYVSFHQVGVQWGIYIPISGLVITAFGAFGHLQCDATTKIRLAFRLIHQHELFHFGMDYASAQLELLGGRPVWRAERDSRHPKYNVREEKLANAWMLRSLWRGPSSQKVKGRSEAVRRFISAMPEGYRDAGPFTASARFFPEVDALVVDYARICGAFRPELLRELDGSRLIPFAPYIDWRECPVHVIHDEARVALPPLGLELLRLTGLVEASSFQRDLAKLDPRIQKMWEATKAKLLLDAGIPGLDFKHFEDRGERAYSVRLNKAYRAHIRKVATPPGWEAYRVGDHKGMGHG